MGGRGLTGVQAPRFDFAVSGDDAFHPRPKPPNPRRSFAGKQSTIFFFFCCQLNTLKTSNFFVLTSPSFSPCGKNRGGKKKVEASRRLKQASRSVTFEQPLPSSLGERGAHRLKIKTSTVISCSSGCFPKKGKKKSEGGMEKEREREAI